ncbi:MAG: Ig-like domain-containing protein [Ignavibacteriota bacterium]
MVKRTVQLIKNYYQKIVWSGFECHFDQREKSFFNVCKRFLSRVRRGGLRNDDAFKFDYHSNTVLQTQHHKLFSPLFNSFLIISILFLLSCANQLPPGGGEIDKIPPDIIYSYPENGTTNFKDDNIEFEFSEYVDKRSFKDALFISPAIDEQLEISWTGKSVEIVFPKGLKDSLTYVVTIGTDVVDVNSKNRMENAYAFSFATGDKIDKRSISGKVFGTSIEGTLIFAYKFTDDTAKYLSKKPNYVSQIGKDGSYKLNGLAESTYRVFAVKDQFRDFLYQADQDWIGIPSKEISLFDSDSSYSGLDFFLIKVDTIKPRMLTTVMTDQNHFVVTLSEECDSATYLADNFQIVDSTSNQILPLEYSYHTKTKREEFVLVNNNKLNPENNYYLLSKKLRDLEGNIFDNELSSFTVSDRKDTSASKLLRTSPGRNGSIDFKNPDVELFFDDAIVNKDLKSAIGFTDTSKNKVAFNLIRIDDANYSLKPEMDLKPEKNYEVKINLNYFKDAAGNKIDSIFTLMFHTISGIEFTGISGKISSTKSNIVVVLQDSKDPKKFFTAVPDKTLFYSFERINPGTYSMWLYSDTNSSKTFDYGYPEPFRKSEEFYVVPDTIKLRSRWSVTDYDVVFE